MIQEWDVTKQLVETQLAFKKLQRDFHVLNKRFGKLQESYREATIDLEDKNKELDHLRSELIDWRKKATEGNYVRSAQTIMHSRGSYLLKP